MARIAATFQRPNRWHQAFYSYSFRVFFLVQYQFILKLQNNNKGHIARPKKYEKCFIIQKILQIIEVT